MTTISKKAKAKTTAPVKAQAKALRNTTDVAVASYLFAGSTETIITAIKNAVEEKQTPEKIALDFRAGRIARSLDPALSQDDAIAKAKGIVGACQHGRTPKAGQAVRTEGEQQLFEATKRWWSRVGRDAGVIKARAPKAPKTTEGKPEEKAPKTKAEAPVETPKPAAITTPEAALASLQNMLHMATAFCDKYPTLLAKTVADKVKATAKAIDKRAKAA